MFFYDFLKNYKYLNYFIEVRNFLKMYPEKNVRSGGSSIALVVSEKSAQKITINH